MCSSILLLFLVLCGLCAFLWLSVFWRDVCLYLFTYFSVSKEKERTVSFCFLFCLWPKKEFISSATRLENRNGYYSNWLEGRRAGENLISMSPNILSFFFLSLLFLHFCILLFLFSLSLATKVEEEKATWFAVCVLFPFSTRRSLLFCKKRIGELWPLCCKLSPFLLAFCVVAEIVIFSVAAAAAAKELFSVLRRGEFNFRSLPPLYSAAVFFVALLDSADSEGTDLALFICCGSGGFWPLCEKGRFAAGRWICFLLFFFLPKRDWLSWRFLLLAKSLPFLSFPLCFLSLFFICLQRAIYSLFFFFFFCEEKIFFEGSLSRSGPFLFLCSVVGGNVLALALCWILFHRVFGGSGGEQAADLIFFLRNFSLLHQPLGWLASSLREFFFRLLLLLLLHIITTLIAAVAVSVQ